MSGHSCCSFGLRGLASEVPRDTEASTFDIVERSEAGSQGVDVNPEHLGSLELATRLGKSISKLIDRKKALGRLTCDISLNVRWLAGTVTALEMDELMHKGASSLGNSLLDREPDR